MRPDTHQRLHVTFLWHALSQGRAAAEEQWERGETGGCGVDRTGWVRGEVSRRAKVGLKGTRKGFYFSQVIWAKLLEKLSEFVCKKCNMQGLGMGGISVLSPLSVSRSATRWILQYCHYSDRHRHFGFSTHTRAISLHLPLLTVIILIQLRLHPLTTITDGRTQWKHWMSYNFSVEDCAYYTNICCLLYDTQLHSLTGAYFQSIYLIRYRISNIKKNRKSIYSGQYWYWGGPPEISQCMGNTESWFECIIPFNFAT